MHLFKLLIWLGILPQPVVKHGTSRVVWIFPKFAVKFPKTEIKMLCKIIWKYRKNIQSLKILFLSKTQQFPVSLHNLFTKGFLNNWDEFIFYLKNRDCLFLFPTYFSFFGWFNITPIGKEFTEEQGLSLWKFKNEDRHHFVKHYNFCFYQGRKCIWDYGDPLTQTVILRDVEIMNNFSQEADLK